MTKADRMTQLRHIPTPPVRSIFSGIWNGLVTAKDSFADARASLVGSWQGLPILTRDLLTAVLFGAAWFPGWALLASTTLWYPTNIATYWRVGAWLVFGLATRRVIPRTSFWLIVVFFPVTYDGFLASYFHFLPLLLAGYSGTRFGRIKPLLAGPVVVISTILFLGIGLTGFPTSWEYAYWVVEAVLRIRPSSLAVYLVLTVGSVILGTMVRKLADTSEALAQRNRELERLHAVESERAVAVERTRIARELHDVITHHLTAIVIRAQAADRVAENTPAAPAEAVRWIAEAGRECLNSLRSIVKVLKTDDGPEAGVFTAPSLEDIHVAAERMSQAGLAVRVQFPQTHPTYPPLVELALVRITQEALTNVLKHSIAPSATVALHVKAQLVVLTIHDAGPQRGVDWSDFTSPGRGSGLTNMAQRAEAVNGALVAGPDGEGGWLVRAALPLGQAPIPASEAPTANAPALVASPAFDPPESSIVKAPVTPIPEATVVEEDADASPEAAITNV